MKHCLPLLVMMTLTTFCLAQDQECADLRAAKQQTFGFRPSQMEPQAQKTAAADMDRFWGLVKSEGDQGVSCLRDMLLGEQSDLFFVFDGSVLLISLDQSRASLDAVSQALPRTDLKEIDPAGYVRFLLRLSRLNVDIGPFAEKYLTYPKVDAYVPEHSMKLDRFAGGALLYGSMEPALADKYLIAALDAKERYTRSTAAQLLAISSSEDALRALRSHQAVLKALSRDERANVEPALKYSAVELPSAPKLTRERVLRRFKRIDEDTHPSGEIKLSIQASPSSVEPEDPPYVAGDRDFILSAIATLTADDLPMLRQARRNVIRGLSDESLDEYAAMNEILLGVINHLDLYKDLREHGSPSAHAAD